MTSRFDTYRLPLEVLAIAGAAAGVAGLATEWLAPQQTGWLRAMLLVAGTLLLGAPAAYWRNLRAAERAPRNSPPATRLVGMGWAVGATVFAFTLGLVLTAFGTLWQQKTVEHRIGERFEQHAGRIEREVHRRFELPLSGLRSAAGVWASSDGVRRLEFRDFVQSRNIDEEFPGVRGFGFIERVMRKDLDVFIAHEQSDSAPGFAVKTQGNAADLYVIKYIEPLSRNKAALGLDVGSEPVRREATERAVRTGHPALTGRITLVQDGRKGAGFLYLLPIYLRNTQPANPVQRELLLTGLVYAPLAMAELMQGLGAAADDLIDIEIFDGDAARPDRLLLDLDGHLGKHQEDTPIPAVYADRSYTEDRVLLIGGRKLLLRMSSTPAFERASDRSPPYVVAIGGTFLSFGIALAVWLLASSSARAQRQAERMTIDLARLAKVVRHTTNRVIITDREGQIEWVNEAYEQARGQTLAELTGQFPLELLPMATKPDTPAPESELQRLVRAGASFKGEVSVTCPDGNACWLDVDMQPLHDEAGTLKGYMFIESDITERVTSTSRLQAAMRDTSALLQTLNAHAIVSVTDRRGRIVDINEAFCSISGYSREELIGADHRILNSGYHPKEFWRDFWRTIQGGKPWRGIVRNRAKDGRFYWVDSMVAPFIGADGRVEKFISIRTDITESKAAELALKEATGRLELAIEGGSDGLWDWIDVHGHAQWWSPQFYRLLGFEPDEIEATVVKLDELVHPDDKPRVLAALRAALQGTEGYDLEHRVLTKQGVYRWFRSRAKVYFDAEGNAQRMAGSIQDVDERKRAEAVLAETSSLLRSVLDSTSSVSVIAIDTQRRVMVFNRGAQLLLGYEAQEMVGQATTERIHDPEERAQLSARMTRELGRDVPPARVFADPSVLGKPLECSYVHKDGTKIPVSLTVTAMYDAAGKHFGYVGVAHDIRERKAYESSLREARERAESASQSKSQFLANMSHEIRTPMNAILGMLRLLQGTPLTTRQRDYAAKTEGAARSLLGLLNDILDYSKAEAGKMVLDPQPFEIDRLLRDLSVILTANLGDKALEILYDVDPALPRHLVGDSLRLQQVLINLGGNAIKFTERGMVHIKFSVQERNADSVTVAISIRDTGIGIAPENQQHIFDGFTQAEASTTRRYGGTGLGLVISRHLVQLMGGDLALESALGVGTCFSFSLCLPVAPDDAASAVPALAVPAGRPPHVLVVDDNAVARDVLGTMIETLRWRADFAASGAEALSMSEQRRDAGDPYDIVLLDWVMPGQDGWETARALRAQNHAGANPLLIMVTAHGTSALAKRSDEDQTLLDGFVPKPLTARMLSDAVAEAAATRADAGMPRRQIVHGTSERLQGLRVLLVEDNANNRQVAQELLSEEGALVTLAENGQQGVTAVLGATTPFDAVLMDLQMPVMDGLQATRSLREEHGYTRLPIIAMTANAMASDRDACLQAGMNDHVGKPFDLDQLVRTLLRHCGRTLDTSSPDERESQALPGDIQAYCVENRLDLKSALVRMGNNSQAYLRALRSFTQDLASLPDMVADLLRAQHREDACRALHTLKGMAGTVGLPELSRVASTAETRLRSHQDRATEATVTTELREACTSGLRHARWLLVALSPATTQDPASTGAANPLDTDVLLHDLDELKRLLGEADMQALDVHARIQTQHGPQLGNSMQALDEAIAALDFPGAADQCDALAKPFARQLEAT